MLSAMGRCLPCLAVTVSLLGGCAEQGTADRANAADTYRTALSGVCAALGAAARGDVPTARDHYGTAHPALHALAADAGLVDSRAAANLVEYEQRAESALASAAAELPVLLEALTATTRTAYTAATGTVAGECTDVLSGEAG